MKAARIEIRHVSKSFPGVKALQKVSVTIAAGEIHALCGENGAGKSTLMNVLSGNLRPDEGEIYMNGEVIDFAGPRDALNMGIAVVYQHLSLADELSIAENIFANQQPVNRMGLIDFATLNELTKELLHRLDIRLDPATLVTHLSPAQKQMVEIAKALAKNPQVLILDEPTASLTDDSIKTLFQIIVKLRDKGSSIIYISHRLSEIFQIADRVSVLKDGKFQGTFQADRLSRIELIRYMIGRDVEVLQPTKRERGEVVLEVKNLTAARFRNISFNLHKGEVLGLAGLVGAGRTEIARAIFGVDNYQRGEIKIHDKQVHLHHAKDAVQHGIGYVPEDRKTSGLFLDLSITDNIVSSCLECVKDKYLFDAGDSSRLAESLKVKLNIVTPSLQQQAMNLSGGNQQKTLLAKWLATNPKVLIVDEPTHGVDVGAKQDIYKILADLASKGIAILIISSELPELLALCDRILVIRQGKVSGELSSLEATEEKILSLAM